MTNYYYLCMLKEWLRVTGYGLWVMGYGLWVTGYGYWGSAKMKEKD